MKKKTGSVKYHLSNEKYHAHNALSKSDIAAMEPSLEHYRTKLLIPKISTNAMELGSAIHTAILEPYEFSKRYMVVPDFETKSATGKQELTLKTIMAERAGKKIIFKSAADACFVIRQRFIEHPKIGKMFDGRSHIESSFFWKDDETGIACKCRPDLVSLEHGYILNVKSAFDPTEEKMEQTVNSFKYHYSAYFETMGVQKVTGKKITAYFFAAIDSFAPYGMIPYVMGNASMRVAEKEIGERLSKYAQAIKTNIWPGYSPEIRTLDLPRWKLLKSGLFTKEELNNY